MDAAPFTTQYVTATVAEYDPILWCDPRNAAPRAVFVPWVVRNLNMRDVSDAQLAARWRAFLAGWHAHVTS